MQATISPASTDISILLFRDFPIEQDKPGAKPKTRRVNGSKHTFSELVGSALAFFRITYKHIQKGIGIRY